MRRISAFLILFLALAGPVCAEVFIDRINAIPDITQTDPAARFPYGGVHYCGPAAVSNSLMWLADHGYEKLLPQRARPNGAQAQMACVLGEKYMETSLDEGTSPAALLEGVHNYVKDSGYQYKRLQYQGWRKHALQFGTGVSVPSLEWIKSGLRGDSAVWLNIGWYAFDRSTREYRRLGGHWVTMVGFGADQHGREDPNMLVIHDPGPKQSRTLSNRYIKLERIMSGRILAAQGTDLSAAGYYKILSGMKIKSDADLAIVDGAVVLQMQPAYKPVYSRN